MSDSPLSPSNHSHSNAGLSVLMTAVSRVPPPQVAFAPRASIKHDLEMTRTAILYADQVTIVSPSVGRLTMMAAASVAAENRNDELLSKYLAALTGRGTDSIIVAAERDTALRMGDEVAEVLRTDPDWQELGRPIVENILTIEPYIGGDPVPALAELLHLLEHGHGSEPGWITMVDETVGLILDVASKLQGQRPVAVRASREVALAAHVLDRIPGFHSTPMDELLDARRELTKPLTRFRASMADYSKTLSAEPMTPAFQREADELYRSKVAPALLEVREAGEDAKVWPALRREVAESSGGRVVEVAASLVVTSALEFSAVLQAGAAAATVAMDVAGATAKRVREARSRQQTNGLYWLYEVAHKPKN